MLKRLKKWWIGEEHEPSDFEIWAFGKPVPTRYRDRIERWNERHGEHLLIGSCSVEDSLTIMKCLYYRQVIKQDQDVEI